MSQTVGIIRQWGPETDPNNARGIHLKGIAFDATFSEKHEIGAEVTENPVETGVSVADHMFLKPQRVTISAGVSDLQLSSNPSDPFGGGTSRAKAAFDLLTQLQATFEPFNVVTGLKLYKNMVVNNITCIQDKDTPNAFVFEAELREVILVNTQTVRVPPTKKGTNINPPKQRGTVQAIYVTDKNKQIAILNGLDRAINLPTVPVPPELQ